MDATTLKQLVDASREIAARLDLRAPGLPDCAGGPAPDATCRDSVVAVLATRAFRRAPSSAELASLSTLFDAGASNASFRAGAELVVRALLGSPNLLYETALGAGAATPQQQLTSDELASQLAWLVSGHPPDAELLAAGARGELGQPQERARQALRLLGNPDSRSLYRRFVEEWLGLNRLRSLAKSNQVISDFPTLREAMLRETDSLVDDALVSSGGSITALLAGGYSFVPDELADLYGVAPPGETRRTGLASLGRVGLLQQASFLSTFAHEDGSAPVLRGKAVLERLLCRKLPKPSELGIDLVLPPPDPTATTRERFAAHAARASCAGCHDAIDGIGFAFENFDAVGRFRSEQAGKAIDTSGHLTLDGEQVALSSSVDLSKALARSEEVRDCVARQWVRFAAGGDAPDVEAEFVERTRALPAGERGSLAGLLLAYVQSDWFALRKAP